MIATGDGYEAVNKINSFMSRITHRFSELGLEINPNKCAAINFGKQENNRIKIRVNGGIIGS